MYDIAPRFCKANDLKDNYEKTLMLPDYSICNLGHCHGSDGEEDYYRVGDRFTRAADSGRKWLTISAYSTMGKDHAV